MEIPQELTSKEFQRNHPHERLACCAQILACRTVLMRLEIGLATGSTEPDQHQPIHPKQMHPNFDSEPCTLSDPETFLRH
jgi:hypothetical protein